MKYVYIFMHVWKIKILKVLFRSKKEITDIKRHNVTAETFETFKESSRMSETMLLWTVKLHSLLTASVTSGEQFNQRPQVKQEEALEFKSQVTRKVPSFCQMSWERSAQS